MFHIDALTGEDARYAERPETETILQGFDVIAGPLVEAYLVQDANIKYVLLFDEFLQVRHGKFLR